MEENECVCPICENKSYKFEVPENITPPLNDVALNEGINNPPIIVSPDLLTFVFNTLVKFSILEIE